MSNKKSSTFSKITKVVVWIMLIAMIGAMVGSAIFSIISL